MTLGLENVTIAALLATEIPLLVNESFFLDLRICTAKLGILVINT